jgi:hypothetical protein
MNTQPLLHQLLILMTFVLPANSQPHGLNDYRLKIKTDEGTFKGALTRIDTSYIEILHKKTGATSVFLPSQIKVITIKKPFLNNVGKGVVTGAAAGTFLVLSYYIKEYARYGQTDPSDPPFGRALWMTAAVGAGVGLIYNGIESLFTRKRFMVNKVPVYYEAQRNKLAKYLFY